MALWPMARGAVAVQEEKQPPRAPVLPPLPLQEKAQPRALAADVLTLWQAVQRSLPALRRLIYSQIAARGAGRWRGRGHLICGLPT